MRAVTGASFSGVQATLEGYAPYLVKNTNYPGAIAEPGQQTVGTLYRGIDAGSLRRLDRYEDTIYVRRKVIVHTKNGDTVAAETYIVPPQRRWALSSKLWDKERFTRRHLKTFLQSLREH